MNFPQASYYGSSAHIDSPIAPPSFRTFIHIWHPWSMAYPSWFIHSKGCLWTRPGGTARGWAHQVLRQGWQEWEAWYFTGSPLGHEAGGQIAHVTSVCRSLWLPQKKNSVIPIQYRISDCIKFSLDDLIIISSYTCKMTGLGIPLGSLLPQASFYTWINLEVKWLVHGHAGKKWQHLI